jgi:hypothetical protein
MTGSPHPRDALADSRSARKSDDTAENVQPAGVARAQLSALKRELLFRQFRSKIDLHPLSQLDRKHRTLL